MENDPVKKSWYKEAKRPKALATQKGKIPVAILPASLIR